MIEAARRAAGPAVAAGILLWASRERAALIVALVASVVLAMGLVAPRAMQTLDRGIGRVAQGIAVALSTLLGGLAWLLVVLPIWALSKLFGYSPLDAGWTSRRTAWVRHPETRTPNGRARDVSRMSGLEPKLAPIARRRARARLLIPVAVVAGLPLFVHFVDVPWLALPKRGTGVIDLRTNHPGTKADIPDEELEWVGLPVDDYAHEDEPWAKDFFRELIGMGAYHDYVLGQRLRDFRGEYLNIVDGRRVTRSPQASPQLTVWFFGGSTLFGIAQRDDHTFPSVISELAERDGLPIRAVNFGVSGDNAWVSTLRLAEALTEEEAPDLVVFYDGANEYGVAGRRLEEGSTDPGDLERYGVSDDERATHRESHGGPAPVEGDEYIELQTSLAAAQYGSSSKIGDRIASAYGVPVRRIWQPFPFAKTPSPADDELWRRLLTDPETLPRSKAAYADMLARSAVDAIDVSGALDHVDRPVFFDSSHTNEYGTRVIATAAYDRLKTTFEQLSERSGR